MLKTMQPSETLCRIAMRMFRDLWDRRAAQADDEVKAMRRQLAKVDKMITDLLDQMVDLRVKSVIQAYEQRIAKLQEEKLFLVERINGATQSGRSYDDAARTALAFLANPWSLWASGRLEDRRMVLKLAFAKPLRYTRDSGLRTAELSLPFKMLQGQNLADGNWRAGQNRTANTYFIEINR